MKKSKTLITSRIKSLLKSKNVTLKTLAKEINMSEMGLNKSINSGTLKLSTLLDIAEFLDVKMHDLFYDYDNVMTTGKDIHSDMLLVAQRYVRFYELQKEASKLEIKTINKLNKK